MITSPSPLREAATNGKVYLQEADSHLSAIPRLVEVHGTNELPQRNTFPGLDRSVGARETPIWQGFNGDHEPADEPTKRISFYLTELRAMGALVPRQQMAPV